MKRVLTAAGGLAVCASAATAGGVERSTQSASILFEEGRYAELNFGYASPDVSGSFGGVVSGNMSPNYGTLSFGYKQRLNDNVDFAIILDQPIGADVDYPSDTGYALAGTNAELKSQAVTALLRYRFASNVSVFGGVRAQSVEGEANITYPTLPVAYSLKTNKDHEFGYVVGVAWEKPEIAARIALTYNSAIKHTFESTENNSTYGLPFPNEGSFETEIPQSVNLEFQSGIAADTLLFGSIRWVDWSEFDISPAGYSSPFLFNSPLVSYESDRITYNIGIGRKFTEEWSGAVTLGYEPKNDDVTGNLGPVDGYKSVGLAATYTRGNMEITGGVRYVDIGGVSTTLQNPATGERAKFDDSDAWAAGLRIGFKF